MHYKSEKMNDVGKTYKVIGKQSIMTNNVGNLGTDLDELILGYS